MRDHARAHTPAHTCRPRGPCRAAARCAPRSRRAAGPAASAARGGSRAGWRAWGPTGARPSARRRPAPRTGTSRPNAARPPARAADWRAGALRATHGSSSRQSRPTAVTSRRSHHTAVTSRGNHSNGTGTSPTAVIITASRQYISHGSHVTRAVTSVPRHPHADAGSISGGVGGASIPRASARCRRRSGSRSARAYASGRRPLNAASPAARMAGSTAAVIASRLQQGSS